MPKWTLLLFLLLFTLPVKAADRFAATCSSVDINSAISSAVSGVDRVIVPSGTCTFTTPVANTPTVNLNKNIPLIGATVCTGRAATLSCTQNTIILDGTGTGFQEDPFYISVSGARISGFTIKDTRASVDSKGYIETAKGITGWRIDHTDIHSNVGGTGTGECVEAHGYGLIDHVICENAGTAFPAYGDSSSDAHYPGDTSWSTAMSFGTANAVYVEDCLLDYHAAVLNGQDNYSGARNVFRSNAIIGTNWDSHGTDSGGLRSALQQEVYRNTFINNGTHISQLFNTRGGSMYVFENTISSAGGSFDTFWDLYNYRSDCNAGECGTWGNCDGTSAGASGTAGDQNTGGQQGYICRDQIGRGTESTPSSDWPITATGYTFSEQSWPDYSWGNSYKGVAPTISNLIISGFLAVTRAQAFHIINNRDFYMEAASFDGTSGTGTGLLSGRPATCTTGVAYWATDQGSWNVSGSGTQGMLYKCTSTNTWTSGYTPYTYPHPLQGGGSPVANFNSLSLNFFNQFISTSSSIPLVAVLTNTGTATLTISSAVLSGTNAANFGNSTTCGASLGAGNSCNYSFTFTPSALGPRSAVFTITDNAPGSPHVITLTGTGVHQISGVGTIKGTGTIKVSP